MTDPMTSADALRRDPDRAGLRTLAEAKGTGVAVLDDGGERVWIEGDRNRYGQPKLRPGTRVRHTLTGRHGRVYAYSPHYHYGSTYPVTFNDGVTQHVTDTELDILQPPLPPPTDTDPDSDLLPTSPWFWIFLILHIAAGGAPVGQRDTSVISCPARSGPPSKECAPRCAQ